MFIAQLGRQPEISLTELQAVFGEKNIKQIAANFALVNSQAFDIDRLGGTIKYAEIVHEFQAQKDDSTSYLTASRYINDHYGPAWKSAEGKITLGLSAYHLRISPRSVQKTGILLKNLLKKSGVSLRLIPNNDISLSTATSHNNKLGSSERKIELVIVKTNDRRIIIAEGRGVQNITAYTIRDRHRPKRDAFVGMLPPKLAQIMINLAVGPAQARVAEEATQSADITILDPFCGTGTILQEAALQGLAVYGTDLSEKMIHYTRDNLNWLQQSHRIQTDWYIHQADATEVTWRQPIDAVVCETYLGQPFSAPPSPAKLKEVVGNCNHIISSFLKNIHPQLQPSTPLCIAIPAWQDKQGKFTHLPLRRNLQELGYEQTTTTPLLYHRPGQVVAREILVLKAIRQKALKTS